MPSSAANLRTSTTPLPPLPPYPPTAPSTLRATGGSKVDGDGLSAAARTAPKIRSIHVRSHWSNAIKILAVVPDNEVKTKLARQVLSRLRHLTVPAGLPPRAVAAGSTDGAFETYQCSINQLPSSPHHLLSPDHSPKHAGNRDDRVVTEGSLVQEAAEGHNGHCRS